MWKLNAEIAIYINGQRRKIENNTLFSLAMCANQPYKCSMQTHTSDRIGAFVDNTRKWNVNRCRRRFRFEKQVLFIYFTFFFFLRFLRVCRQVLYTMTTDEPWRIVLRHSLTERGRV